MTKSNVQAINTPNTATENLTEEEKVQKVILGLVENLNEIQTIRDHMTEVVKKAAILHDIEGKIIRKTAKIIQKGNLDEVEQENATVKALVEQVTK